MERLIAAAASAAALIAFTSPAPAQQVFPACQSQQALDQILNSDGKLMPDGCRNVTVTPVKSGDHRLCLIDFSKADDGILQKLRSAALPEKWWVRCDRLDESGG